jgi:hypothetical protein
MSTAGVPNTLPRRKAELLVPELVPRILVNEEKEEY